MAGRNVEGGGLSGAVMQKDGGLPGAKNIDDAGEQRCGAGESVCGLTAAVIERQSAPSALRIISRMSSCCGAIRISRPAA